MHPTAPTHNAGPKFQMPNLALADGTPKPLADIYNMDVETDRSYRALCQELQSYVNAADQIQGLASQARLAAITALSALVEHKQPSITSGVSFDDLEAITEVFLQWNREIPELDAANKERAEDTLNEAFQSIVEAGFAYHRAAFENTILPQLRDFRNESSLPELISQRDIEQLKDKALEWLDATPEDFFISDAMLVCLDKDSFGLLFDLLSGITGSSPEVLSGIQEVEGILNTYEHVRIEDMDLSRYTDARAFTDALGDQVQVLELINCQLSEVTALAIARYVKTAPELRELRLPRNQCDSTAALSIFESVIRHRNQLEVLDLSNNWIDADALVGILANLSQNSSLTNINLSRNHISLAGPLGGFVQSQVQTLKETRSKLTINLDKQSNI